MSRWDVWPNRTACDILEEMRKADETKNYSYLKGLIEEMQMVASRMEAGLYDKGDVKDWSKKRSKLKDDIKKLENKKEKLEAAAGENKHLGGEFKADE